jgi:hypothetical protein
LAHLGDGEVDACMASGNAKARFPSTLDAIELIDLVGVLG